LCMQSDQERAASSRPGAAASVIQTPTCSASPHIPTHTHDHNAAHTYFLGTKIPEMSPPDSSTHKVLDGVISLNNWPIDQIRRFPRCLVVTVPKTMLLSWRLILYRCEPAAPIKPTPRTLYSPMLCGYHPTSAALRYRGGCKWDKNAGGSARLSCDYPPAPAATVPSRGERGGDVRHALPPWRVLLRVPSAAHGRPDHWTAATART
jgi:hypothetical protein